MPRFNNLFSAKTERAAKMGRAYEAGYASYGITKSPTFETPDLDIETAYGWGFRQAEEDATNG